MNKRIGLSRTVCPSDVLLLLPQAKDSGPTSAIPTLWSQVSRGG